MEAKLSYFCSTDWNIKTVSIANAHFHWFLLFLLKFLLRTRHPHQTPLFPYWRQKNLRQKSNGAHIKSIFHCTEYLLRIGLDSTLICILTWLYTVLCSICFVFQLCLKITDSRVVLNFMNILTNRRLLFS